MARFPRRYSPCLATRLDLGPFPGVSRQGATTPESDNSSRRPALGSRPLFTTGCTLPHVKDFRVLGRLAGIPRPGQDRRLR